MRPVIAIDGPAGVGKSSVSKRLAQTLGWTYLDTGAMYRAITLAWLISKQPFSRLKDLDWLHAIDLDLSNGKVVLDGQDVTSDIRLPQVTAEVSSVSAVPQVRQVLTELQRRIGDRRPCVLDGRDIGTVVFPDAFLKIFLTATPAIRAERRWLQMGGPNSPQSLDHILLELVERDRKDAEREIAPLRKAEDAWSFSTDHKDLDEVHAELSDEARRRIRALGWDAA